MLNDFFSALAFLTILPVRKKEISQRILTYFPLVGFLLGIILTLVNRFLTKLFPSSITNLFILLTLILLTGGLHIDGFADSFDGFFSGKDKGEILRIMDDPHIGTKGVVAVFFLLLFKFLILEKLKFKYQPLILMPIISRWAMVVAINFAQPAKNEGLGKIFTEEKDYLPRLSLSMPCLIASLFTLGLTVFFLAFRSIILIFVCIIFIFALLKYSNKKISGITGDILGAINEIAELCVLFFFLFF